FIAAILDAERSPAFLESFAPFARRCALIGALNSLSQLVLKVAMPGVPDFYQGQELWDLSLVDPDNRRPVDFGRRRELLTKIDAGVPAATSCFDQLPAPPPPPGARGARGPAPPGRAPAGTATTATPSSWSSPASAGGCLCTSDGQR